VDGYADYRGVPVVGAWTWLDDYGFGVVTEIDVGEAYRPLFILRTTFYILFALLIAAAIAIFVFLIVVAKQKRAVQEAVLVAKELGQYALEEKLGEGGMGAVYKARHKLMRRPTAIKLLHPDKVSDAALARFEREVQLTSQLNHPNTIAIYDYGRTPEGVFYYAMEYLDGINLEDLVTKFGPLPEGRVVDILRQVCGSLGEAHGIGLVHRDIKPANLVLNMRGGIFDFVKVLDFGLVKAMDEKKEMQLTAANTVTGTPLYLSPEAIDRPDTVDSRTDVYAIGAVGYFLLTGTPVFQGTTLVEICMAHLKKAPQSPSERLGRPISAQLEAILLQCLAKDRSERFADMQSIADELLRCACAATWTRANAAAWWQQFRDGRLSPQSTGPAADTRSNLDVTGAYDGSLATKVE
jgi:serine/threonine protein kinase